jgi:hypothetical protein
MLVRARSPNLCAFSPYPPSLGAFGEHRYPRGTTVRYDMGTVLKRRFLGSSVVFLAAFLSAFILYSTFFARPAYIERPADVLLPEDNSRFDQSFRPPALAPENPAPSRAVDKSHSTAGIGNGGSQHLEASKVDSSPLSTTSVVTATPSVSSTTETHKEWKFNATRDSRAYGLTTEQCESAFPGLFTEIERAVAYRKSVGQISPEDIDISSRDNGCVQAMIVDQQVRAIFIFPVILIV